MKSTRFAKSALLALCLATAASTFAQNAYPNKPIRFVVGFPAGASIDIVSRTVLENISSRTSATIIVDNKPGALGSIGADFVAKAAADGYTMMPSSSATHSSGPHLSKALDKLDVVTGMTHVGRMVHFDIAVVTSKEHGFPSAKSLIAAAKLKPDALTYGYGSGTGQIAGAAFAKAGEMKVRGIPYKGQPAAVTDLVGGQTSYVASDLGAVLSFVRAKTLTAVAIASEKRSTILPDVPTTAELGLKGATLVGWIGVSGPANLSPEAVKWWSEQLKLSLAVPQVQEKLNGIGMEPDLLLAAPFQKFVGEEHVRWGKSVHDAGLQAE